MPFKPNYNQQRRERTRAKEQKQQEKLQRRQEKAAARKSGDADPAVETPDDTAAPETRD
jgi:hypothetical protein